MFVCAVPFAVADFLSPDTRATPTNNKSTHQQKCSIIFFAFDWLAKTDLEKLQTVKCQISDTKVKYIVWGTIHFKLNALLSVN